MKQHPRRVGDRYKLYPLVNGLLLFQFTGIALAVVLLVLMSARNSGMRFGSVPYDIAAVCGSVFDFSFFDLREGAISGSSPRLGQAIGYISLCLDAAHFGHGAYTTVSTSLSRSAFRHRGTSGYACNTDVNTQQVLPQALLRTDV